MKRYIIKCDECKTTMGRTDSMVESAQGGRCIKCRKKWDTTGLANKIFNAKMKRAKK